MTKNIIISFQLLRFFAPVLIFISHTNELFGFENGITLKYLGCASVSLFIALSAYLTYLTNDNYNQISAATTLKKRLKQFYLLHLITLIIAIPLSVNSLVSDHISWIICFVANLTLLQSYIPIFSVYYSFNGVAWYLSLMLYLALLTPITLRLWKRMSLKTSIIALVVIGVMEYLLTFLFFSSPYVQWVVYVFPVIRYFDFFCGGAAYKLAKYIRDRKLYTLNKIICCISIVLIICLALISVFLGNRYFLTAVWLLPSHMLVMSLSNIRIELNVENIIFKGIMGFADISLEFFMLHQLVIKYFTLVMENTMIPLVLVLIISFIISTVGAILLQQFIRKLKAVQFVKLSNLKRRN